MNKVTRLLKLFMILGIISVLINPSYSAFSQEERVTLTVAMPSDAKGIDTTTLVRDFETANPSIHLIITEIADTASSVSSQDPFVGLQQLASSGDVLLVSGDQLMADRTLTGAFLDLNPLVQADATFDTNDFFPVAWKSFQWDKGLWALPSYFTLYILTYDPTLFDNVGLLHPADAWTTDDLVVTAKTLTAYAGGSTPSIYVPSGIATAILMRSLAGEGVVDVSIAPNEPRLDKPVVEKLLTTWHELERDGILLDDISSKDPNQIGIHIARLDRLPRTINRIKTLLPNNKAGVEPWGFAISAGTQHPDKAYILAKYLAGRSEFAERFSIVGAIAARQSTNTILSSNLAADEKAFLGKAVENAIPFADLRYGEYFEKALAMMLTSQVDAKTALQRVQLEALQHQQAALEKKGTFIIHVVVPATTSSPLQNKITLRFGLVSMSSSYNQQVWQSVIDEFLATDGEVGQINLEFELSNTLDKFTGKYDCFYLPYNALSQAASLSTLYNFDPLIDADPSFSRDDMLSGVLSQLSLDNKIWGYPLTIQPEVLKYDANQFQQANIPFPTDGWTINAFTDALKALKSDPAAPPVFMKSRLDISQTHLLMLIAAYGSLPLDYRTDPPTVNYTDPETIQNIKQVLDLAKQGYIDYKRTGDFSMPPAALSSTAAIYTVGLDALSFGSLPLAGTQLTAYKLATYPQGTQFSTASYSVSAAYISAIAQNPEACYRWISTIAKHPEIFSAMPASLTLLNSPALEAQQGADTVQTYKRIEDILSQPNTVTFPTLTGLTPKSAPLEEWLYRAFDAYVFDGSDLEATLRDAEQLSKAYQGCIATVPPYDSQAQTAEDYYKQYAACYQKVQTGGP